MKETRRWNNKEVISRDLELSRYNFKCIKGTVWTEGTKSLIIVQHSGKSLLIKTTLLFAIFNRILTMSTSNRLSHLNPTSTRAKQWPWTLNMNTSFITSSSPIATTPTQWTIRPMELSCSTKTIYQMTTTWYIPMKKKPSLHWHHLNTTFLLWMLQIKTRRRKIIRTI